MFERLSGVQKILKDFPWMWAVTRGYGELTDITVRTLQGEELSDVMRDLTWWAKIIGNAGEAVVEIPSTPTQRIATAIREKLRLNALDVLLDSEYRVTHLVSAYSRSYFIYRPRKDVDLTAAIRNRA